MVGGSFLSLVACALFGLPGGHFCQGPFDPRELPVRRLPQFADTSDARGLLHAELGISIDEVSSSYPRRDFRAFFAILQVHHSTRSGFPSQAGHSNVGRYQDSVAMQILQTAAQTERTVLPDLSSTLAECDRLVLCAWDKANHTGTRSTTMQPHGNLSQIGLNGNSPRATEDGRHHQGQRSKSAKGNKTPKNQGNQGQPMQQPVLAYDAACTNHDGSKYADVPTDGISISADEHDREHLPPLPTSRYSLANEYACRGQDACTSFANTSTGTDNDVCANYAEYACSTMHISSQGTCELYERSGCFVD